MPNGSETEGMTYRSAILIDLLDIVAVQKSGKENLVADAHLGGHFDDPVHHVAGAGHDKFDILDLFEDLLAAIRKYSGLSAW